jgi:hypothetical protein
MRIVEIGEGRYVAGYAPGITDFYTTRKNAPPGERLTPRVLLRLRRRLRSGKYDLVVYHLMGKVAAPWHRQTSFIKIAIELLRSFLSFNRIAWHLFHYILCGTDTPLVVIDTQDVPRLTKTESLWLDRSRFFFMRELPPNHMSLFLNMDRLCGDVINIQRQEKLRRNFPKIKPFSLGFDATENLNFAPVAPDKKIYDVFYIGANHTTTVRQQGIEELRALKAAGLRVFIPEQRLPRPEFFQTCAQSWLVWSPEGQGWDCHRHYEALMVWSVPLINYPTIERHQPLREGEHCLYHRPEVGGLTDAIHAALRDPNALVKIAEQGRAHVLQYHRRCQLVRHVLATVGLLEKAEPHIVDR